MPAAGKQSELWNADFSTLPHGNSMERFRECCYPSHNYMTRYLPYLMTWCLPIFSSRTSIPLATPHLPPTNPATHQNSLHSSLPLLTPHTEKEAPRWIGNTMSSPSPKPQIRQSSHLSPPPLHPSLSPPPRPLPSNPDPQNKSRRIEVAECAVYRRDPDAVSSNKGGKKG